jgi:hypothetical protein
MYVLHKQASSGTTSFKFLCSVLLRVLARASKKGVKSEKEIEHHKQDYEVLDFGIVESLLSITIVKDVFGRSINKFLFCNCSEGEFG